MARIVDGPGVHVSIVTAEARGPADVEVTCTICGAVLYLRTARAAA